MRTYPIPFNEQARLAALRNLPGLTSENDAMFDAICDATRKMFDCPIAHISVVDDDTQWYKSVVGMELGPMPKELSFCTYAIMSDDVMVVPDMTRDARFAQHPMVVPGSPEARFYVGVPLVLSNGFRFGSLCALDLKPHAHPDAAQLDTLRAMGRAVVAGLERPAASPTPEAGDDDSQAGFFNLISHELRTPLTVILASLKMLRARLSDPADRRLADAALKSSENLAKLVESIITFSDVTTGELRLNEQTCDIGALVADVTEMHVPSLDGTENALRMGTAGFAGPVQIDADQIKLALAALTLNALVHGGKDMQLHTGCDADGNLEIRVEDNGTLGGHVDLAELYKPFVVGGKLENRGTRGGLGLGLPLTRKLVELHGGDFEVHAEEGRTVALIRLPRWRVDAGQNPVVIAAE